MRACVFVADQCREVLVVPRSVASTAGILTIQRSKNASKRKCILSEAQKYFKIISQFKRS